MLKVLRSQLLDGKSALTKISKTEVFRLRLGEGVIAQWSPTIMAGIKNKEFSSIEFDDEVKPIELTGADGKTAMVQFLPVSKVNESATFKAGELSKLIGAPVKSKEDINSVLDLCKLLEDVEI